jgi:hypothetical protein
LWREAVERDVRQILEAAPEDIERLEFEIDRRADEIGRNVIFGDRAVEAEELSAGRMPRRYRTAQRARQPGEVVGRSAGQRCDFIREEFAVD